MAIGAPNLQSATPISSTRIDLSWEPGGEYAWIHIERRTDGTPPWVEIAMVGGEERGYPDEYPPLTPEETYDYQIRGRVLYPVEEYSGYSGIKSATCPATLANPSLCVATAFSNFIEITWKDNSTREDEFKLWRKVGAGEWAEYATIPANMDYYRDTSITPGTLYTYRVRAWDGEEPSPDYSNEDSAEALRIPSDLTTLAISDIQDTSMVLTWAGENEGQWRFPTLYHVNDSVKNTDHYICILQHTSDAAKEPGVGATWTTYWRLITGYKILISDSGVFGGEEITRIIGAGIARFLVTSLLPSTQYWVRVGAYNGVGSSAYDAANDTTLVAGVYVPTEFEKWIRNPNIEPVYLAEIYTKMDLTGFTLESGVTWKKTIGLTDRGIDILEVFEDGDAYVEKTSIVTVEATASTFWFDYDNRILYVHTSDDTDPANFLIEGAFWLYFSTHKDIEFTVESGRLHHYLPLLSKEDIPDITQEIKRYFEGSFGIASGSIAFANGKIGGEPFFDKKYADYTWENSKLVLKAGKSDFIYANFQPVLTSFIDEKTCEDSKITFTLRDLRQEMGRDLILNKYWKDDQGDGLPWYPDMEEDFVGEPIPICLGIKSGVVPVPIDVENRKYKYQDGRSHEVIEVYKNWVDVNSVALVEDTDYFVDLQRSIITFAEAFELSEEDSITVTFTGAVNSADEPILNGSEVFKKLMNERYELLDSELNLDSIYEAKYAKTSGLSVFLYKDTPYDEIVRTIEHSVEAYTFQDAEGRLGLRPQMTAAASKAKYIGNHQIFNHLQSKRRSSLFWKVNVWYNENPQSQEWEVRSAQDDNIFIRYKNRNELNIYSYFAIPLPPLTLATNVKALLNKETIQDTLPMLLFDVMAGDIIKFSRDRFYSTSGTASEISMRIISISKSPASGKTSITAELV